MGGALAALGPMAPRWRLNSPPPQRAPAQFQFHLFSHSHTSTLHANPNQHYRCSAFVFLACCFNSPSLALLLLSTLTFIFPSLPPFSSTLIIGLSPNPSFRPLREFVGCVRFAKKKSVFCVRAACSVFPYVFGHRIVATVHCGFYFPIISIPPIFIAAQLEL